jgi:hypothetical protein
VNKRVNIPPTDQSSTLVAKFIPRVKLHPREQTYVVKNWPLSRLKYLANQVFKYYFVLCRVRIDLITPYYVVWLICRVTRLCEFLPIWRLFSLDIFLNYRSSPKIFGHFFPQYRFRVHLEIKRWATYILGHFSTNSSGRRVNLLNRWPTDKITG